ncbi:MAG: DUF721 domain-containing protein [Bacteroidaceae bacterium]|uniref:DUF721 domain-containing protein n=1 Tax=Pseudoprevotella muciniphila TaxID=2133944 RepID=A0A5P8E581_9BACT|nr:DUF721 domain-containing protein [Pseudoprevotella muciniphila]MBQ7056730.1 DUF721 domain-containing protein [Bacteroidaceae bacterium]QFQ12076.1 DUF721 domain-containing protein [Pseudoprevotella muciniphila]
MKRRNETDIKELLQLFLRESQLETPLNEYRLINSWEKVAGKVVQRYTDGLRIHNQKLIVRLKSPALRSDLMMRRQELVNKLNEEVGAKVIYDIEFH